MCESIQGEDIKEMTKITSILEPKTTHHLTVQIEMMQMVELLLFGLLFKSNYDRIERTLVFQEFQALHQV